MVGIDPALWQAREGVPALFRTLAEAGGTVRPVGGFVRDALLGAAGRDLDLATSIAPDEVLRRIALAGFKAVPTGLAHGTVTAVLPSGPVEITTLRRDVETDGRRARIAYTDSWEEDAARRDFTVNAMSADARTGTIHDYFGGLVDLEAGLVRFIGEPLTRIAEDHLRILRFFRFHARFGAGAPDADALAACTARANDLLALSRERIAGELLQLLALPDPTPTLALIVECGIVRPVLPEINRDGVARLAELVARECSAGVPPAALRRLSALLPADAALASDVGARLRLSNAARTRLAAAADPVPPASITGDAFRHGTEAVLDRLLLRGATAQDAAQGAALLARWTRPAFPLSGGSLIALGLPPGPIVARTLAAIRDRWIDAGFPGPGDLDDSARIAVDQALRDIANR